jgi:hypothetical protein
LSTRRDETPLLLIDPVDVEEEDEEEEEIGLHNAAAAA